MNDHTATDTPQAAPAVGARLEPGVRPRATDADVREVRMPTTLAEAEAMMRVASHWLEAHAPETLRAMLRATTLAAENERLLTALADVVDTDWAFLGRDADTANPESLYSRVRRGRLALGPNVAIEAGPTAAP